MQIVDKATMAPGHCIVTQSSEGPFIDTGLTPALMDPRVYVSRQAVIDMAVTFGMPAPQEVEQLRSENARLAAHNLQLEHELSEADRYAEAAEYTLQASFGSETKIKNKPGRKPKVNS